jgi:hypothetical protein
MFKKSIIVGIQINWKIISINYISYITWIAQSVYQRSTGWTAGVRFSAGARDFSLFHSVQADFGAYSASYPMGMRALPSDVKWQGREADVKNGGAILTPSYAFMEWCFIN